MRVVSFNIHHGTVGRRGPVDPDQLGEVCAAFDADVIALQEVDRGTYRTDRADLAATAAGACAMAHVFGPSRRYPGGHYGNALLVRGSITDVAIRRLPRVPTLRFWQERRTVLGAQVDVDGTSLWIAATHLAVPKVVNGPQLEVLLRDAGRRPGPVVVLGDLNRSTKAVISHAAAAGLSLVPHGPTYPAEAPKRTIDHVLTSPDLVVRSVEVRSTPMSDHAALVVDLGPASA